MQKIHSNGLNDTRYFWNVSAIASTGAKVKTQYRSRCATADGVKTQFKARGHKSIRVSAVQA